MFLTKNGNFFKKLGARVAIQNNFSTDGISFLNDNEVLIVDYCSNRIQRLNIQAGIVVISFGKKGRKKGELSYPVDATADDNCCNRVGK